MNKAAKATLETSVISDREYNSKTLALVIDKTYIHWQGIS